MQNSRQACISALWTQMPTMNLFEVAKLKILHNLASFFQADRYFLRIFSSISFFSVVSSVGQKIPSFFNWIFRWVRSALRRLAAQDDASISDLVIAIGFSLAGACLSDRLF